MILYHTTDQADAILADGFRDGEDSYMLAATTLRGVFLSDTPLNINDGVTGDELLEVAFPDDVDLDEFELIEAAKPYREWCVPAALINERGHVQLIA